VKLLFDQNLSFKLVGKLDDIYPDSLHVGEAGLASADDIDVWNYAVENGFVVVSKDDDFRQMSMLRGAPPKVIWLQVGNCTTAEVSELLRRRYPVVESFARDDEASFLIVPKDAA